MDEYWLQFRRTWSLVFCPSKLQIEHVIGRNVFKIKLSNYFFHCMVHIFNGCGIVVYNRTKGFFFYLIFLKFILLIHMILIQMVSTKNFFIV